MAGFCAGCHASDLPINGESLQIVRLPPPAGPPYSTRLPGCRTRLTALDGYAPILRLPMPVGTDTCFEVMPILQSDAELNPMAAVADPAPAQRQPAPAQRRLPSFVNLQALLRRLSRICRSRMGSTVRVPRFSCTSWSRRFLFYPASCPAVPSTSSIRGASWTVCGFSSSLPASILERSSTFDEAEQVRGGAVNALERFQRLFPCRSAPRGQSGPGRACTGERRGARQTSRRAPDPRPEFSSA